MKPAAIGMVFLLSALTLSGVRAEIYSWTDENGVKHYSHMPPADHSAQIKTAPEIQSDPPAEQRLEKINEENVEAILEELDREEQAPPPAPAKTRKPPSRQERIQMEKEKLEDKIAWLEQLPPRAYTNMRSKQAIIGRYQYRMQELLSNPDTYFEKYGK